MILRPRQRTFVDKCLKALEQHGNTLGIAPTGAGKTIMLSASTAEVLAGKKARHGKALVLAHRDELTSQNRLKFSQVAPGISTGVYDANSKSWDGKVTFAMVQTLSNPKNLATMPPLDLVVIDEAHHTAAASYQSIIKAAKTNNPDVMVFGVTATPERSDKKALRDTYNNVADQITIRELISYGFLVPPRTFIVDVGIKDQLAALDPKEVAGDYNMDKVQAIMDGVTVNAEVLRHWRAKAGNRQTVVFCSNVLHAEHIAEAFAAAGVSTVCITGKLSSKERAAKLAAFDRGDAQVVVNCAVLTEGWDCQPTSCVILLRPASAKSTMVQMVGRGLRIVDQRLYPGVTKTDCIVLDFGTSTEKHGTIESEASLDAKDTDDEERVAPQKECFQCEALVPIQTRTCPMCGNDLTAGKAEEPKQQQGFLEMREINLLGNSIFRWVDLFGDDTALMATCFSYGGLLVRGKSGIWYGISLTKNDNGPEVGLFRQEWRAEILTVGERTQVLGYVDGWMGENEQAERVLKTTSWLNMPATHKQLSILQHYAKSIPIEKALQAGKMNRYKAMCLITANIAMDNVRNLISQHNVNKRSRKNNER